MTDVITATPMPLSVVINDDAFTRAEPVMLGEILVAIYLRVSSDGQAKKGYGLDTQDEICNVYYERFKESHNWRVFKTYVEKKGVKGDTTERAALEELIKDARIHGIKFVIVAYLNRQSREEYAGFYIDKILGDAGITLVSATQDADPYKVDPFIRSIQRAVDAEDKRKINKQTRDGMDKAARDGHWTGGPAPFGYEIVGQGKRRSSIQIREKEQKVILRAVELIVDQRKNLTETCDILNDEGLLTRSKRKWAPNNLDKRLRSESMAGRSTYRKAPGDGKWNGTVYTKLDESGKPLYGPPIVRQLPHLITPSRHRLLMKALETNGHNNERGDYPIGRHIIGGCGGHYVGHSNNGAQRSYVCNGGTSTTRREECTDPSLRADLVDEAVWKEVSEFLKDQSRLERLAQEWIGELPTDRQAHEENVKLLWKLTEKLKTQLVTIATDLTDPDLDETLKEIKQASQSAMIQTYKVKTTELGQARRRLEQYDTMHADVLRIVELVKSAQLHLDNMTDMERKVLFGLLRLRVEIDEENYVPLSGAQSPLEEWHRAEDVPIPADPSDALWERVADLLYAQQRGLKQKRVSRERARMLLRAMLHRLRTGCRWPDLPAQFIPGITTSWQTIATNQHKWWRDGTWQAMVALMNENGPSSPLMTRKPLPRLLITGRITPDLLDSNGILSATPGQDPQSLSEDSRIFSFTLHAG